ncbi:MAG: ATP-binding protein [Patescibacteria group bacterium]|nr:ATP-binding protein [Patescibacteria group bacterium]
MVYISRFAEKQLEHSLKSGKIVIVLGSRQVGKTTMVERFVAGKKAVFLNLDVELNKQKLESLSKIDPKDAFRNLGNPDIIIIDEAQRLASAASIVKGWYDSKMPCKFILLGSSSLSLAKNASESLAGRNIKITLAPLSFREIVKNQSWYSEDYSWDFIQNNFKEQIKNLLLETIVFGSFPEVISTAEKRVYLTNLVSDYLLQDILHMGLVKNPDIIKKLLALLAFQVASEVSVNELANRLAISRVTVERYLDLLEQTYVIFRLKSFSHNPRREISKNSKIYFWDTGVRNAILNEFNVSELRSDIGQLWENWVIAEFAKYNAHSFFERNLYFWRTRGGSEVDLVVKDSKGILAYEVKWSDKSKPVGGAFYSAYKTIPKIINSKNPLLV